MKSQNLVMDGFSESRAALAQAAAPPGEGRVLVMRVRIAILSVATFIMSGLALAQGMTPAATNPPVSHDIVTPDQLVWKTLVLGAEMAVVFGDLDKKGGLCVIRIRSKGEVKVPPHWHVTDEHIMVLEGSFWIGPGEQFDASKLQEMKVGAHAMMPAGVRHFSLTKANNSLTKANNVIELFGEAPFVVNFVNPEDDPRRAKSK
jgi:mannose-6-phosphate isomerase-like protein (cupin superfamily)